MSSYEAAVFLGAVAAIYIVVLGLKTWRPEWLKRYGITLEGVAILLRTERFNDVIQRLGAKFRKYLLIYGSLSVVAGAFLAAYGTYMLHVNAWLLAVGATGAAPTHPIIPGVTVGFEALPYLALAFLATLIPHELTHGLVLAAENLRVKSAGVMLFLMLPGGFVELDEERLAKAKLLTKLRVFASGSFTNLIVGLIIVLISSLILVPGGVMVKKVVPETPAAETLKPGDVIVMMNNTSIKHFDDLVRFLAGTRPGNTVILKVKRGGETLNVVITLARHPVNSSRGFIGAYFDNYFPNDPSGVLTRVIWWLLVVTISISVINILPIYPLDGGRIFREVTCKYLGEKRGNVLTALVTAYYTALLLVNIGLSIWRWGLRIWYP